MADLQRKLCPCGCGVGAAKAPLTEGGALDNGPSGEWCDG